MKSSQNATTTAVSIHPDDFTETAYLEERVDSLKRASSRRGGETSRISMHGTPTYLRALWAAEIEERGLPVGMTLAVGILAGLETLRKEAETVRYDDVATKVRTADHRTLPLKHRTRLHRAIGTSKNPGIVFKPNLPCGETETWDFKPPKRPADWLYGRAAQLGMSASSLAVYCVGQGLAELLVDEGGIDPEASRALARDRRDLLGAIDSKAEELEDLWAIYTAGRGQ